MERMGCARAAVQPAAAPAGDQKLRRLELLDLLLDGPDRKPGAPLDLAQMGLPRGYPIQEPGDLSAGAGRQHVWKHGRIVWSRRTIDRRWQPRAAPHKVKRFT